ncbi:hypothetical protein DV738_g1294, partial [Chaetothyriales sp. CBS 135597]
MAKTFEESLLLQPDPRLPCTFTNIHFLAGPNPAKPISLTVNRVSSSRRFNVLSVDVRQEGRPMCFVTCTFMAADPWKGKAMQHASARAVGSPRISPRITIDVNHDDLSLGRRHHSGPFMAFQRLPLMKKPEHTIAPIACHITPAITSHDPFIHVLGVLSLSDYHVLDFPPSAHGIPFGLAPIGQPVKNTTESHLKFFTSLNHTIHFERNHGFRADQVMYVQVTSPWASNGRAVMNTKIFTGQENLVATCVQEAYYILKDNAESATGSKL